MEHSIFVLITAASRHWSAGCTRCDASADLRVWCFSCPLWWSFWHQDSQPQTEQHYWWPAWEPMLGLVPGTIAFLTKTRFRRFVEYFGTEKTVVLATPYRLIDAPRSGSVAQLTNIFQRGRSTTNQYLCSGIG